ncbi:MAG: STAS domain-containing protein [Phycisphaerales bacterium]|nr:STAS domain-containing protein [Phycisphaerales bacterium]
MFETLVGENGLGEWGDLLGAWGGWGFAGVLGLASILGTTVLASFNNVGTMVRRRPISDRTLEPGDRIIRLATDMTDPQAIERLIGQVTAALGRGVTATVIDCQAVIQVDSCAVAALVQIAKRIHAVRSHARLTGVSGKLARLLEIYRLIPVLQRAGVSVEMV